MLLIIVFVANQLLLALSAKLGILPIKMTSALLLMKVAWSAIRLDTVKNGL